MSWCQTCGLTWTKTKTCCMGRVQSKARIVSPGGIIFRPHTLGTMVWAWIEKTSEENPMRLQQERGFWELVTPNNDYGFEGSLMECLEAADREVSP